MTLTRSFGLLLGAALLAAPTVQAKTAKKEFRVTCKDGETSRPGRGACSGHGGIASDGKSGVVCKDGSFSDNSGRGACSGHGGVALKGEAELKSDKQVKARKESAKDYDKDAKRAEKQNKEAAKEADKADKEELKANREARKDVIKSDKEARKANKDAMEEAKKPQVTCKDGTIKSGRMGCFGHGGVAKTDLEPREQRTRGDRKTATGSGGDEPGGVTMSPTGATARCKDGKYSHAKHHTGACSNHGGVDKWLDADVK